MIKVLYALSPTNNLISAAKGAIAFCPDCNAELVPKCGTLVTHHWAHKSVTDCDSKYHDGMSQWHYTWQQEIKNPIPGVNIEVPVVQGVQYKRADLKPSHGCIIEFQKSPLPIEERELREQHYGSMIWVVHWDRIKSKTWVSKSSRTPVLFELPSQQELVCSEWDIVIPRLRFVRTFINGKVCNEQIWIKVKERLEKTRKNQCPVCFPRIALRTNITTGYVSPTQYIVYCNDMRCNESKITVMFQWLNSEYSAYETVAREEREKKEKAEWERRFFSDPSTLQNLLWKVGSIERDHEWGELIKVERERERIFYKIKEQREKEEAIKAKNLIKPVLCEYTHQFCKRIQGNLLYKQSLEWFCLKCESRAVIL